MLKAILKKLMFDRDITIKQLAESTGVKAPVLYKIISGETPNPSISNILPIAKFFGMTINELIGDSPLASSVHNSNQLVQKYLAYVPLIEWSEILGWEDTSISIKPKRTVSIDFNTGSRSFALEINNNDLYPTFPMGTIIIVDPDLDPTHKSYAIIYSENEYISLKQILIDNTDIYLKPIASVIPPRLRINEKICGVVVEAKIRFNALTNQ